MGNSKISVVLIAVIVVAGGILYFYSENSSGGSSEVFVLHAGSLTKPFDRIDEIDNQFFVKNEPHGSVEVSRLVSEGIKSPDVAAVSDYSLIPDYMISEGLTDWYIQFARNDVVLCYTEQSENSGDINENNWYKILSRPNVSFAFGNPNADPGGYRAVMAVQLAEMYYDNSQIFDVLIAKNTSMSAPEKENGKYTIETKNLDQLNPTDKVAVGAMEVAVIPKLEEGSVDYMFNYRSIATQHGFDYVTLPDQVNLGRVKHADIYDDVRVKLTDGAVKNGKPIVYGITILKDAKNKEAAIDFLKFIFSEKGNSVFENMGQPPINPPRTNNEEALPEELKDLVVQE